MTAELTLALIVCGAIVGTIAGFIANWLADRRLARAFREYRDMEDRFPPGPPPWPRGR